MLNKFLLAGLAGSASARIVGLAAPKTIVANETFPVTLITENYIQTVKDLVAAFALTPRTDAGFIGTEYLGSYYLGPSKSNILTNITFEVTAPADTVSTYLSGIVTSLYGVSNGATTIQWTVPIAFGNEVSSEQNVDFNFTNVCSTSTTAPSGPTSTTSTTSAPASGPTSGDDCFPTSTQSLIQSGQIIALNLIDDILKNQTQQGQQDLGELHGYIGDVSAATGGGKQGENCSGNPTSPPDWPILSGSDSQVRAIDILTDVQSGLIALSQSVLECNKDQAKDIDCRVLELVYELNDYPAFQ